MTNLALSAFIQVVTAVANFKYDIWGQPIGHEKQTCQATADDTDFQQHLGGQSSARNSRCALLFRAALPDGRRPGDRGRQGQRNRIAFEKRAHLQDEIADIIKIKHRFLARI